MKRRTQPMRVEKRRSNRYLHLVDSMRKLARKREQQQHKQAEGETSVCYHGRISLTMAKPKKQHRSVSSMRMSSQRATCIPRKSSVDYDTSGMCSLQPGKNVTGNKCSHSRRLLNCNALDSILPSSKLWLLFNSSVKVCRMVRKRPLGRCRQEVKHR